MLRTKQTAIENLQQEASELLAIAKKVNNYIPNDLPEVADIWGTRRNIRINLPFDKNLFQVVRAKLGKSWRLASSFSNDEGYLFTTLIHTDGVEVVITMKPDLDGSVCQVKQVGVKEVPIMEVVCQ